MLVHFTFYSIKAFGTFIKMKKIGKFIFRVRVLVSNFFIANLDRGKYRLSMRVSPGGGGGVLVPLFPSKIVLCSHVARLFSLFVPLLINLTIFFLFFNKY